MKTIYIYALALIIFTGCKEVAPIPEKPVITNVPPVTTDFKVDWSDKTYTAFLSEAIDSHGADLLKTVPTDAAAYGFKGGSKDQIKRFYMLLISSMARYESAFNPKSDTYECRKTCVYEKCRKVEGRGYCMLGGDVLDGGLVISRGLLQISLQSAKGYGCKVTKPTELNDPKTNLVCAVTILNKWVAKDKKIGTEKLGGARYWSVLRESSDSRPKIIAKVKAL